MNVVPELMPSVTVRDARPGENSKRRVVLDTHGATRTHYAPNEARVLAAKLLEMADEAES